MPVSNVVAFSAGEQSVEIELRQGNLLTMKFGFSEASALGEGNDTWRKYSARSERRNDRLPTQVSN